MKGKAIAYIRTSTNGQDGEGQRKSILEFCVSKGLKVDTWEMEKISSRAKVADRQITKVVDGMEKGDRLIVSELSRLGRSSITEVFSIIERIKEKGADLEIVSEGLSIKAGKTDVKTEAVLSALSLAGRIEREMISERTKNALKARKEAGVKLGRPEGSSRLVKNDEEIKKYIDKKISITSIAKLLDVSRGTLYAYLKKRGKNKQRKQTEKKMKTRKTQ